MSVVDTRGKAGYDPKHRFKVVDDNSLTHGDKIRAMSDYDLADWIAHILICHGHFVRQIDRLDCDKECPLYKCCNDQPYDNIEDWLKSPEEDAKK